MEGEPLTVEETVEQAPAPRRRAPRSRAAAAAVAVEERTRRGSRGSERDLMTAR